MRRGRRGSAGALAAMVLLSALGSACSGDDGTVDGLEVEGRPRLALRVVTDDLDAPVGIASAPDDPRLFVLERTTGRIRILEDGRLLAEPFLDLGERLTANGEGDPAGLGERGLLALAFHPDYAENGRFFVYYADFSGLSELVEYHASDDPDRADPDSGVVLRQFGPSDEHYGGTLAFAPDGALWFSIGDGGSLPGAASTTNPRGALHRYDASTPGALVAAAGNPFLGDDPGADELWATGLRNPWRFALDGEQGLVFIADVGRVSIEEISVAPLDAAGLDYGWPDHEGTLCQREGGCAPDDGSVPPAVELPRAEEVCAIVGGVVYRGDAIPALDGAYLYSDYCAGFLRSFRYVDGEVADEVQWFDEIGRVASLGVDADGEVYLVTQPTGTLYELVPAD